MDNIFLDSPADECKKPTLSTGSWFTSCLHLQTHIKCIWLLKPPFKILHLFRIDINKIKGIFMTLFPGDEIMELVTELLFMKAE